VDDGVVDGVTVDVGHAGYLRRFVGGRIDKQRRDEVLRRHRRLFHDIADAFASETAHTAGREL
jgi:hypothetical protein